MKSLNRSQQAWNWGAGSSKQVPQVRPQQATLKSPPAGDPRTNGKAKEKVPDPPVNLETQETGNGDNLNFAVETFSGEIKKDLEIIAANRLTMSRETFVMEVSKVQELLTRTKEFVLMVENESRETENKKVKDALEKFENQIQVLTQKIPNFQEEFDTQKEVIQAAVCTKLQILLGLENHLENANPKTLIQHLKDQSHFLETNAREQKNVLEQIANKTFTTIREEFGRLQLELQEGQTSSSEDLEKRIQFLDDSLNFLDRANGCLDLSLERLTQDTELEETFIRKMASQQANFVTNLKKLQQNFADLQKHQVTQKKTINEIHVKCNALLLETSEMTKKLDSCFQELGTQKQGLEVLQEIIRESKNSILSALEEDGLRTRQLVRIGNNQILDSVQASFVDQNQVIAGLIDEQGNDIQNAFEDAIQDENDELEEAIHAQAAATQQNLNQIREDILWEVVNLTDSVESNQKVLLQLLSDGFTSMENQFNQQSQAPIDLGPIIAASTNGVAQGIQNVDFPLLLGPLLVPIGATLSNVNQSLQEISEQVTGLQQGQQQMAQTTQQQLEQHQVFQQQLQDIGNINPPQPSGPLDPHPENGNDRFLAKAVEIGVAWGGRHTNSWRNRLLTQTEIVVGVNQGGEGILNSLKTKSYALVRFHVDLLGALSSYSPIPGKDSGTGSHIQTRVKIFPVHLTYEKGDTSGIPYARAEIALLDKNYLTGKLGVQAGLGMYGDPEKLTFSELVNSVGKITEFPKALFQLDTWKSLPKLWRENQAYGFAGVSVDSGGFVKFPLPVGVKLGASLVTRVPGTPYFVTDGPSSKAVSEKMVGSGLTPQQLEQILNREFQKQEKLFEKKISTIHKSLTENQKHLTNELVNSSKTTLAEVNKAVEKIASEEANQQIERHKEVLKEFQTNQNQLHTCCSSLAQKLDSDVGKPTTDHEGLGEKPTDMISESLRSALFVIFTHQAVVVIGTGIFAGLAYNFLYVVQRRSTNYNVKTTCRLLRRSIPAGYVAALSLAGVHVLYNYAFSLPATYKWPWLKKLLEMTPDAVGSVPAAADPLGEIVSYWVFRGVMMFPWCWIVGSTVRQLWFTPGQAPVLFLKLGASFLVFSFMTKYWDEWLLEDIEIPASLPCPDVNNSPYSEVMEHCSETFETLFFGDPFDIPEF